MKFTFQPSVRTGRFTHTKPRGVEICWPKDVVDVLREHDVDYDCVLSLGAYNSLVQIDRLTLGEDPVRDVLRAVLAAGEYGVPTGGGQNIDFIAQRCIIVRQSTAKDIARSGLTADEVARLQSNESPSFPVGSRGILTESDIDLIKAVRPPLRSCEVRLSDYIRFLPGGKGWSSASRLNREEVVSLLGIAFQDLDGQRKTLPYTAGCYER